MNAALAADRPVVLAAGGTGGHLFPAEALARELTGRGRTVALVTDRRGLKLPVDGVRTFQVPAGRLGAGLGAKLKGLAGLAAGTLRALLLLRRLRPSAVVGFGGYPSLPTMLAALKLGLPTVIHDQNAVLGRANAWLAPRVRRIATHFPEIAGLRPRDAGKLVHTGNPVRPAIVALAASPYVPPMPEGRIAVLAIGGSQGARILSRVLPEAVLALPEALRARLDLAQQARPEDLDAVLARYRAGGMKPEIRTFFDDMPRRLSTAHLVIARAGGSTTAELAAVGRPAILVPYAAALGDEQTANARQLERAGGAWVLPEADFTPETLTGLLARLLADGAALACAAAAVRTCARPEAARALADLVERVAEEARP